MATKESSTRKPAKASTKRSKRIPSVKRLEARRPLKNLDSLINCQTRDYTK